MRVGVARRSALVLALLVVGTVLGTAPSALASGPTSLGVSGWQVYSNTNVYANPQWYYEVHGDPGEYNAAPAIPAQNDAGWAACGLNSPIRYSQWGTGPLCPNASTIGMAVGSILPDCWNHLNFTYFQALVSIPAGTTISQFSVNMSGADDGARVSLVNSANPGGVTPPGGYIYQYTGQSTGNLAPYVVAGEVNRVVITQVDDCAIGNNLNSAQISLNGTVIPPDTTAPTASPTVSPAPNGNGWNKTDATVAWNWTDSGSNASGIDTSNCTTSSTSSGEGVQTLTATCADQAGNVGHASQVVRVDKTAPTLTVPGPLSVESPSATSVTYSATASDNLDPSPNVSCSPASGSTFPLGLTTVSCTATDQAGNSSSKSFTVAVSQPVPAPGQANGMTSNTSGVQEQNASSATMDTGSPDFTGQPWYTPVAASGGQGHPAYGRYAGTDWLSQYAINGISYNEQWVRYRASFDAPNGNMTLKVMADNAVTGIWVNGVSIGTCSRTAPCGGFTLPGTTVSIPNADVQPTGNVVLIEVLNSERDLQGPGGVDFEIVPQAPTVTPVITGTVGSNGWYTSDVSVHWNVVGADSTTGCGDASLTTDTSGTTFTCTAVNLGGTTQHSVTLKRDATAPSISASATSGGNPYTAGTWTNKDVTVHFTCTDGGSNVASVTGDQTVSAEGSGQSESGTCTDNAGNTASATFSDIRIDKTAPADQPAFESAPNANGWYKSDATVDWNWTDGGSGTANCDTSSTSSGEGTITLTSTCTDVAGNSSSDSVTVNVDKTAPSASAVAETAPNANGWYNADVTVDWNWADGVSGTDPSNCTTSSTSTGEGSAIVLTATCTDLAGNTASSSYTVSVDKTAPVVTYSGNAGTYDVDQTVAITCAASDSLSGVASNTCANVSGSAVSFGLGTHTYSASATDKAGNTGNGSTSFTVVVTYGGLCRLVDQWVGNAGIANSLCVKLNAAAAAAARGQAKTAANDIAAFDNEVSAQSGKAIPAAQATTLTNLAAHL